MEQSKEYQFEQIETKWNKIFLSKDIYQSSTDKNLKKFYCLEMFPYPSGKIHMGHVRNYSIGDVIARFKRLQGYNVKHPIGWDAFGLPAENAAIENGVAPAEWTFENIAQMRKQLQRLGFSYTWEQEICTAKEDYYRWGQWFFVKMFERGLVYKKKSEVNWCSKCNTVLANEQVEDGKCWRHTNTGVLKKPLEQWYFKITDYAQELLDGHEQLKNAWPEKVLTMQKNWIGRSVGTSALFRGETSPDLEIYTTRADTLMGVTYMAISFNHQNLKQYLSPEIDKNALEEFLIKCRKIDQNTDYEKEGFFTGTYIRHPINEEKIPLYIANFVLAEYGTGAVMAVPAHDQRDFEFSQKYQIPQKQVIELRDKDGRGIVWDRNKALVDYGYLINSGEFDNLSSEEAKKKITDCLVSKNLGEQKVNYKLKDWLISRQRYWGNPIPVIYCPKCGIITVPPEDLPVRLPQPETIRQETNYQFKVRSEIIDGSNENSSSNPPKSISTPNSTELKVDPLSENDEYKETSCPKCQSSAQRETDTMDTFTCSSWYFLRHLDPMNKEFAFTKESADYWQSVDQYIGGIEHACMHLLYARFWHKVARDMDMISSDEPFERLLTQGMVTSPTCYQPSTKTYLNLRQHPEIDLKNPVHPETKEDLIIRTEKMGKSKNNGVDPDEMIEKYGADTVRLFSLFAAPPEKDLEFNEKGVEGCFRFLNKIWKYGIKLIEFQSKLKSEKKEAAINSSTAKQAVSPEAKKLRTKLHQTIAKVSEDMDRRYQFNTAIASLMEFYNALSGFTPTHLFEYELERESFIAILRMLNPFAPFITEELASRLAIGSPLYRGSWPKAISQYMVEEQVTVIFQVNGKLRGKEVVTKDIAKEKLMDLAKQSLNVAKFIEGKEIVKEIIVPGKLVNIVVK